MRLLQILLFLAGVGLCWMVPLGAPGTRLPWQHYVVPLAVAGLVLLPSLRSPLSRALEFIARPTPTQRWKTAGILVVIALIYLPLTAVLQGRTFVPAWQDEYMYLIQAQMLARFRLWMPPHPLGDFFDTFYIFARPVYASQSFPGCSLMYVPAVWLHLPFWLIPLLLAGLCVGAIYLLISQLVDGVAGVLAAGVLLAGRVFRNLSLKTLAGIPTLLLGMIAVLAWLHWRKTRSKGALVVMGTCAGWAAITRPADAACLTSGVALAMLFDLRHEWRSAWKPLGLIALCAAPFLSLQAVFDYGVTGDVFKTPFSYYNDIDQPQVTLGLPVFNPHLRPKSIIAEKQLMYNVWSIPWIKRHQPGNFVHDWITTRIPRALLVSCGHPFFIALLALGLLGLTDLRRWVLFSTWPVFVGLYAFYTIFLDAYPVVVVPAAALLIVLGLQKVRGWFGAGSAWAMAPMGMAFGVVLVALPELNPGRLDDGFPAPQVQIGFKLDEMIPNRAVVLIRYDRSHPELDSPHEELVYNFNVAWPDDARVIRAQDLGRERNRELIHYYATRQPDRDIYVYIRATKELSRLGNVADIERGITSPAWPATRPPSTLPR